MNFPEVVNWSGDCGEWKSRGNGDGGEGEREKEVCVVISSE